MCNINNTSTPLATPTTRLTIPITALTTNTTATTITTAKTSAALAHLVDLPAELVAVDDLLMPIGLHRGLARSPCLAV